MSKETDFPQVFKDLRSILEPYAANMELVKDSAKDYYLDGPYSEKWKKKLFFASVDIKKNYVSFYLMPVYMFPDLLEDISPELKKHMQGKSCFNFKRPEPTLFEELAALTRRGAERAKKEA